MTQARLGDEPLVCGGGPVIDDHQNLPCYPRSQIRRVPLF
jgi:hypothetical protein